MTVLERKVKVSTHLGKLNKKKKKRNKLEEGNIIIGIGIICVICLFAYANAVQRRILN